MADYIKIANRIAELKAEKLAELENESSPEVTEDEKKHWAAHLAYTELLVGGDYADNLAVVLTLSRKAKEAMERYMEAWTERRDRMVLETLRGHDLSEPKSA